MQDLAKEKQRSTLPKSNSERTQKLAHPADLFDKGITPKWTTKQPLMVK